LSRDALLHIFYKLRRVLEMTSREKAIEVLNFDEEQAKRYEEFVMFMRAYELEKQLEYYERIKENSNND
jgi:hypothetical protein